MGLELAKVLRAEATMKNNGQIYIEACFILFFIAFVMFGALSGLSSLPNSRDKYNLSKEKSYARKNRPAR